MKPNRGARWEAEAGREGESPSWTQPIMAPGSVRMKGFGAGLYVALVVVLAGCGGDNTTTFVLESGSPSASAKAGASPSTTASGTPASSTLPVTAPTPIPHGRKIIIHTPESNTPTSSPPQGAGTARVGHGTGYALAPCV